MASSAFDEPGAAVGFRRFEIGAAGAAQLYDRLDLKTVSVGKTETVDLQHNDATEQGRQPS
jgi:hypothetical protein